MKRIKHFFKRLGIITNTIINSILLTIVYLIGVGITSIIAKLFRKQFLDVKLSKKDTYWCDLNLKSKPIEEYYRQF